MSSVFEFLCLVSQVRFGPLRAGKGQRRCQRAIPGRHTEIRVVLAAAVRASVCFRAVRAVTRDGCSRGHGPFVGAGAA